MTDSTGTTTYQYDYENRLIKTTKPDGDVVEYKYDPFGRRIEKNVNGTITRFVYDREDILFELDSSGNVLTEYLHGPGIDEPIAMIKGGQTYYYHADGLGSIIAITNFAGQVVQRYEYNSFGEITYQQDPNFIQPYTYTGREYDTKTGLYYYRARYYDAKVGRFITQDPIGFSGGINFYSYVGNNPVNFTDPTGEYAAAIGQVLIRIGPRIGAALAGLAGRIGTIFFTPPPKECKDRNQRCYEALLDCFRYANGDREIEKLCMKAHTTCVTTNLPVIFPHGVWVD